MTNGTNDNLIQRYRLQAQANGQSIFIGKIWGSKDFQTGSMGIWLYGPGETTKVRPPVAEAATLDALYGR